jgi:hypothetical protein
LASAKTSLEFTPKAMGRLYWRVRGASTKTAWSDPFGVTVLPAILVPMTPIDGTREDFEGGETTMEFRWNEVPNITIYDLEIVKTTESGEERPEPYRVDTATASLSLKEGRYRWTVKAVHGSGASSEQSKPLLFELNLCRTDDNHATKSVAFVERRYVYHCRRLGDH